MDTSQLVDLFNRTVAPVRGPRADRRRTSASGTTRAAQSRRGSTRRCSPLSSSVGVDEIHVEMASRELAEVEIVAAIAERLDVGGRHRRREELLDRAAGGGCAPRTTLPRASRRRSGSSFAPDCGLESDGALGGASEAREPRRVASRSSARRSASDRACAHGRRAFLRDVEGAPCRCPAPVVARSKRLPH